MTEEHLPVDVTSTPSPPGPLSLDGRGGESSELDVAAYNESSLKILVRAIRLSQGQFSLILVRCNYAALRSRMAQRLRELSPIPIRELVLPESVKTLYTTIQAELDDEVPQALMVFGLESVSDLSAVLTSSNYVREEFANNFPFPLLLWVNDQVLKKLLRLAPDLESWATSIDFAIATDELIEFLQQEADSLFAKVLEAGADRFVDNAALNLGMGTGKRFELESALKELQNRGCHEPALEASQQFILGRDAYVNDQMERAQQLYQKSLAFWQQSDDLERQACLLFHLGLLWRKYAVLHQAEYKPACGRARDYYQQCVEVLQQANRPDLVAKFINALGEVLLQLMAWDELETLAKAAVELHQTYPDFLRRANAYGFLAEVALAKSAWDEAKQYAQTALETIAQLSQSASDAKNQDIASVWVGQHLLSWYQFLLAQAEQHLERVPEALQNLETARVNCKHEYEPLLYLRILEALRSLYFQQGEYLKAFEIKQEKRLIEYQYNFQAFVGAFHLQPKQQVINPPLTPTGQQAIVAQEIAASGREQFVKRLIERISDNHHKLTVIHGQSGVGKSSIIRVGLVPVLRQQAIGERDALPVVLRVYTDWVETLGRRFAEVFEDVRGKSLPTPVDSKEAIIEQLRLNADRNLLTVLIFDQFEEFFFVCNEPVKRRQFYEFLSVCLDITYVKVILSLREDYLHYLLECNRLNHLAVINHNILDKDILCYLGNFSLDEAKLVIESLTNRSQFYLQPELIDELVRDLAGEVGEVRPIELQVVGSQLHEEKITTLEQYRCLGSNPKAKLVERYLEGVIKDCGFLSSRVVAQLLLYLLTDENNTRPLKTRAELVTDLESTGIEAGAEILNLALEILVGSGIVLLVPESPADRYQLVHDYLVTFIRQQQAPGLLAELAQAKEKQKLTEAQLRQALKEKEEALRLEQEERKRAEIAEIEALNSLSQALWLSHNQLGALLASVKAGRKLQETEVPSENKARVVSRLYQTIGQVRERNHFEGHVASITSVRFSPDGQTIASASDNGIVKLWRIDGTEVQTFQGHSDRVSSISFSPDGQTIASASGDGTVKLWHLDGTEVQTFQAHSDWVSSISFSPDGQTIASASGDGTVKLWHLDGTEVQTFQGHSDRVNSASFSPDGQMIASASADGTVKLWRLDGTEVQTFQGHSDRVNSASFSPDGQMIASASSDKTVKLWHIDGSVVQTFEGHTNWVTSVSFSPDGQMIASASSDKTAKLWRIDGTEIQTFQGHSNWVRSISFSPDGRILASASADGTVKLWRIDGTEIQTFQGHTNWVNSVSFSPDGQMIASASSDKTAKLWRIGGTEIQTFQGHSNWVTSISFSPDGQMIASASGDGTVKLWRIDGTELQTFQGHSDRVNSASFSPDGQMIASASADGTVKLWRIDGTELQTFQGHSYRVTSISFSPDGQMIASASGDGTVKLWGLDGTEIQTFQGHSDRVRIVSFSPDGQMIASASSDRTVKLWRIDGTEIQTFEGHGDRVNSVSFSPDGQMIASASSDGMVKLWRIDGTEIQTFEGHGGTVTSVSFSPDGQMIASASSDGTVKLWRLDGKEWNLDLDELLVRSCNWLRDYLKTNPNVSQSDRILCEGIRTN